MCDVKTLSHALNSFRDFIVQLMYTIIVAVQNYEINQTNVPNTISNTALTPHFFPVDLPVHHKSAISTYSFWLRIGKMHDN